MAELDAVALEIANHRLAAIAEEMGVTSANVEGGRKVAEFLIAGGHKHIAHIAGWSGSSTGRDRQRGFEEGLAAHGQAPVAIA